MSTRTDQILSIEPEVVQTPHGWFAASPRSSALQVGVVAQSEDEAAAVSR